MTRTDLILAYGYLTVAVVMTLWDVLIAGRIANLRRTPRIFQAATAFGGLLIIPALLVAFASASILYGRTVYTVRWIWPLTAVLFVMQATYALTRKMVTPLFGFPILFYNLIIAIIAVSRFMISRGDAGWQLGLTLSAAQTSMLGLFFGPSALWSSSFPTVPVFSPSLPARWRASATVRGMLAVIAMAVTVLVLIQIPTALAAIRSYNKYASQRLQEHPEGDFSIGLKIFPDLRTGPPPLALRYDLAMADSLNVDAISVIVNPEAARGIALDSIAHSIDDIRTDSTKVIVTLGFPKNAHQVFAQSPREYTDARIADINRIARALKPNYLLPVLEPYGEAEQAIGIQSTEYWKNYLTRAARVAHYINPNIRVAVSAATYGSRDSSLYAWAAARGSGIDVVGFSLMPGLDGAISLNTNMLVAQRWMRQYSDKPKEHWVFAAGGYPQAHGDHSQELALWGVLAWATAQPAIKGLVVLEAADYNSIRGIRRSGGNLRPVFSAVQRAERGLAETANPPLPSSQ
jgi:hypothetical protein